MKPNLMRRVQRYGWDKAAEHYDKYWAAQLRPAQEKLLDMAALKAGERVLDVACGTGLVTFPAADQVGPSGAVVATDISEQMIKDASALAAKRGVSNVHFIRTGAEDLKIEAGEQFDAAICALGLMYVPEPVDALKAMSGKVRPGGRVVSAVWGQRAKCGWAEIFPIVDARVESDVCPMFFALGTGDALSIGYRQAGFTDIEEQRLKVTLRYDSDEDALGAAFAGGPVAMAYARFSEQTRDETHAEYLASISAFKVGDRYEIPGEFVVVSGVCG